MWFFALRQAELLGGECGERGERGGSSGDATHAWHGPHAGHGRITGLRAQRAVLAAVLARKKACVSKCDVVLSETFLKSLAALSEKCPCPPGAWLEHPPATMGIQVS